MSESRAGSPVVAYVGFGANMGDPVASLGAATERLRAWPGVRGLVRSPSYWTRPVGLLAQADFLNAVLRVETTLAPLALLDALLAIEDALGRTRELRWGPRTVDLDLLVYADRVLRHPRLTVPHPELHRRGFVLQPLCDLDPSLPHPALGRSVAALLDEWRASRDSPDEEVRLAPEYGAAARAAGQGG